MKDYCY